MLHILILCDRPPRVAETVHQHIDALLQMPGMVVRELPAFGDALASVDFDRFDVIVVHYSLVVALDQYMAPALRERLRISNAVKAVFIQDEYRHIDATIDVFKRIGIDVLFTCMPEASIEAVYPASRLPDVRKVSVLTGYVPASLLGRAKKSYGSRKIGVGYRARKVPAWLGELGQEKWHIGERFAADAARYGLKCDISCREEDRIYGDAWVDFVLSCKAMLGVESGSSVFDFSGQIQTAVDRDVAANPALTFKDLKERHFASFDGKIDQRQISPRCFEAAALKTLMILYEGHYSGLLKPWEHYVPLKKDHSNLIEVVGVLCDEERAQAIVDRAYLEVACKPENQFDAHAAKVAQVLREEHVRRNKTPATGYTDAEFSKVSVPDRQARRRRLTRMVTVHGHFILFHWVLGRLSTKRRDKISNWLHPVMLTLRRILVRRSAHRS